MKKLSKKGFTIVELVIVIAVIGVLAAVLIPTFTKLIRKSKVNNDTQLIRTLNEALAADRVENPHNTMSDVLKAAESYGYILANINAKASGNEIFWDSKNDAFVYLNDGVVEYLPDLVEDGAKLSAGDYRLWKIYTDAVPSDNKYSIYLASQTAADSINNVDINVGIDCGNYYVENIKYTNTGDKRDVVIRTNSEETTLTINDKSTGTIAHYGSTGSLNIIQCFNASYHENGKVSFVEISKGRIVLESGADVNHIHVNAKVDSENNKLDEFDEIVIAKAEVVEMPSLSRDDVDINETTGTLVVALQSGTSTSADKDFVWLTKQGIYEQIKVSDSSTSAGSVWANDESNSQETQTAAQQIANNIGRDNNGQVSASITVSETEYEITIDPDTRELVVVDKDTGVEAEASVVEQAKENAVEAVADKEDIQIGATLFAGGSGSASDPFLIVDYATFQHVSDLYEEGFYYFKVKDGVSVIDCKNWVPVFMNGSFEGNGVRLNNLDETLFKMVGLEGNDTDLSTWTRQPVKIANLTVDFKAISSMDNAIGLTRNVYAENVTFENVKTTGTMVSGSNGAIFFCYTSGNDSGYNPAHSWATVPAGWMQNIYVTDCSVETTIYAPSGSVGVIGGHYCAIGSQLKVVINNIDTIFTGNFYNKSGKYHLMYGSAFATAEGSTTDPGEFVCAKISEATITKGANNYTTTAVSNASYFKVYISAQLSEIGTAVKGITMTLKEVGTIENVSSGQTYNVLDRFGALNFSNKQPESDAFVSDGTLYAKVGATNNFVYGDIRLVVLQFNSSGELLASKSYNIASRSETATQWTIK